MSKTGWPHTHWSDIKAGAGNIAGGISSGAGTLWDGITGKTGADAATSAAEVQAGAIGEAAQLQATAQEQTLELLREQLGITREQFQPFLDAGVGALGELQQGYQAPQGTTASGLNESLAQIMGGGAFGSLVEERQRAVQGQLAAGGLTRSGVALEEAARIPTDLAFQLENMLFGRASGAEANRMGGLENLVSGGRSAAAQEGGQAGSLVQSIIQSITGGANAQAAGLTGAAGASASGILGGAQAQTQGIQNLLNIGGFAIKASDPRLKENVRVIGKVGKLDLVEWDWIPELGDDFFKDAPRMGFMADKVKEIYPEFVVDFGGYDAIYYDGLMKKLNEEGATCH